jgi:hypothetical protein
VRRGVYSACSSAPYDGSADGSCSGSSARDSCLPTQLTRRRQQRGFARTTRCGVSSACTRVIICTTGCCCGRAHFPTRSGEVRCGGGGAGGGCTMGAATAACVTCSPAPWDDAAPARVMRVHALPPLDVAAPTHAHPQSKIRRLPAARSSCVLLDRQRQQQRL